MVKFERTQLIFKFVLIFFLLSCAGKVYAQDFQEVVMIDFLKSDHSIRRETTVKILGRAKNRRLHFKVRRTLISKEGIQFTKSGEVFPPPIRIGSVSIYPSSYSRITGDDTPRGNSKKRVIQLDEQAYLCIEGLLIDDLLGPDTIGSVERDLYLPARPITHARLGMIANFVQVREMSEAEIGMQNRIWMTRLEGDRQGFIGNVVDSIDLGGPAARAGIQIGDLIIALNKEKTRTERKPEIIADYLPASHRVSCVVVRRVAGKLEVLNLVITPTRA